MKNWDAFNAIVFITDTVEYFTRNLNSFSLVLISIHIIPEDTFF